MKLTKVNKDHIDALTLRELKEQWENGTWDNPCFQGETRCYWAERMANMQDQRNEKP